MNEPDPRIAKLRQEIARAQEPVVREALEAKLAEIEAELSGGPNTPTIAPEVAAFAPAREIAPAERRDYDLGVQRLRLLLTRLDWSGAEREVADLRAEYGDSGELLEAFGDVLVHRRKIKEALAAYTEAIARSPKNLGLERKHAETALATEGSLSIEDQLRTGLGGTPIIDADVVARGGVATFLSLLLPGLGQIVLGRQVKGIAFLVAWGLTLLFILAHGQMIVGLARTIGIGQGGTDPSGLFYLALATLLSIALIAVYDCAAITKTTGTKAPVDRPKPPVDLPFE